MPAAPIPTALPLACDTPQKLFRARSRAWAGARVFELRGYASPLSHLLANPGMAPFLAACPQAGRLLRPLCHAIGADLPPCLMPVARPRLQRPPRPPRPRRRRRTRGQ